MRRVGEPSGPSAGRLRRLTEELNDEGLLGAGRDWPDALLVELDHALRPPTHEKRIPLFGAIYVGIPHGICLIGRFIATGVLQFLAWWAVLFTGRYPARWHAFNVGTYRWITRIQMYLGYFTDTYPVFSGKE